jgi:putative membrane protein
MGPILQSLSTFLTAFIALLHFYFLVLEMFFWTKPRGLKVFGNTLAKAQDSAVLAANQGLYNGFLAAGLIWGVVARDVAQSLTVKTFFLSCVAIAGCYGGHSVHKKIFFIQAAPAIVTLVLLYCC